MYIENTEAPADRRDRSRSPHQSPKSNSATKSAARPTTTRARPTANTRPHRRPLMLRPIQQLRHRRTRRIAPAPANNASPYHRLVVRTQSPYQPATSTGQYADPSYGGQAVGGTGPDATAVGSNPYAVRQAAITEPQLPPQYNGPGADRRRAARSGSRIRPAADDRSSAGRNIAGAARRTRNTVRRHNPARRPVFGPPMVRPARSVPIQESRRSRRCPRRPIRPIRSRRCRPIRPSIWTSC